jgi:hypothetical protein
MTNNNAPEKPDTTSGREGEVGYGKPPVAHQFAKGNKLGKGRPKGSKNLKTIVNEAFGVKVPAKIGGKTRKLTKIELAIHQLANKASAGDLKAIGKAITMHEQYGPQEDPAGPSPEQTRTSLEILEDYLALHKMFNGDNDDDS